MNKRGYRTGVISKETAIKRFHEYYNKRSKSPIARLRAKMFDMMYQKSLNLFYDQGNLVQKNIF